MNWDIERAPKIPIYQLIMKHITQSIQMVNYYLVKNYPLNGNWQL